MAQSIIFIRWLGFGIAIGGLIATAVLVFVFRRRSWRVLARFSWIANVIVFYSADIAQRGGLIDVPFLPVWSVLLGAHAAIIFTGALVLRCLEEISARAMQ